MLYNSFSACKLLSNRFVEKLLSHAYIGQAGPYTASVALANGFWFDSYLAAFRFFFFTFFQAHMLPLGVSVRLMLG